MRIVVTGFRGIPGIQGGVETHCEALFPRIVDGRHEVIVVRRKGFISEGYETHLYKGVKIKDIPNPKGKSLESIIHTFRAVIYAKRVGADIVHIHAIGPALMVPFAKLLGMKVVMTHHGPDYDRQKWGRFAKFILRLGESWGIRWADAVIVISNHIKNIVNTRCPSQRHVYLIRNGFALPPVAGGSDYLEHLGVRGVKYVLTVGRFVKEKGFDLLIEAFARLNYNGVRLVIAGDADHEDAYSQMLKKKAKDAGVILTGFVQKDKIAVLCRSCSLFVLPSFHEGLPISLLEAMSCGADVLVSDIPAAHLVSLNGDDYFAKGNDEELAAKMDLRMRGPRKRTYDLESFDWRRIVSRVAGIYDSLAGNP